MRLTLGLLADFANKSADGKLNILGVFNRIFAEEYPAVHQEMKLVLRFEMHPAETGEPKKFQLQLRTEDGRQEMEIAGELNVELKREHRPGEMVQLDQIIGLNRFPVQAAGRYEFVVMVNGEVKGQIPFTAAIRPTKASRAGS